jgi:hypothetical protein
VKQAGAWVVGLAVLAGTVLALRAELMTVHETPDAAATEVVVAAETREDGAYVGEMTRGLVSTCRLLVNADVVESSFREVEPAVFAFRLTPPLGEFDRRELRGCLQDTRVQHLLVDVRRLENIEHDDPEARVGAGVATTAGPR